MNPYMQCPTDQGHDSPAVRPILLLYRTAPKHYSGEHACPERVKPQLLLIPGKHFLGAGSAQVTSPDSLALRPVRNSAPVIYRGQLIGWYDKHKDFSELITAKFDVAKTNAGPMNAALTKFKEVAKEVIDPEPQDVPVTVTPTPAVKVWDVAM